MSHQPSLSLLGDDPRDAWYLPNDANSWFVWEKPTGISFVYLIAVGGGGGGGSGFTGVSGSARGGGGGGGGGSNARLVIPAFVLPDILYVQCGTAGTAGNAAGNTFISTETVTTAAFLLLQGNGGGAGGNGTASIVGTAGGAGTTPASQPIAALAGFWNSGVGQNGGAGGAIAGGAGSVVNYLSVPMCSGGAGGAGTTSGSFTGGLQVSPVASEYTSLSGGSAGGPGQNGIAIRSNRHRMVFTGGTGGGAINAAAGGVGGQGSWGSGGGGGGGGTTGGNGGNGGPGWAFITCW